MLTRLLLLAVCDGETGVVKGVGTLGITVRSADPALDGCGCNASIMSCIDRTYFVTTR